MTLGKIADTLIVQIQRQVAQHGLVAWFDPERIYGGVVDALREHGVAVERFAGSFFELRHRIETACAGAEPTPLVVYLPIEESAALGPLCELLALGVVMKPGRQPKECNTRLAVVARVALSEILQGDAIEPVLRKIESGALGLADLELLAQHSAAVATGSLTLVYGSANPAQIALSFLAIPAHDEALVAKAALPELTALLHQEHGLAPHPPGTIEELRCAFASHCLAVELRESLGELPTVLAGLPDVDQKRAAVTCAELARTWRNRRDLRAAYVERADSVEKSLGLDIDALSLEQLERLSGFRSTEAAYQRAIEQNLIEGAEPGPLALRAADRLESFWSAVAPDIMDRWALIAVVARVLDAATRVEIVLKAAKMTAHALVLGYTGLADPDAPPLCVLDAYHRQMERRYHHFDLDVTGRDDHMERLVSRARSRYTEAASVLAKSFLEALHAAGFNVAGVPGQRDTFERFVRPALETGTVAYLLVDGLRFEMARELFLGIRDDHEAELSVTLGTLPSITEIGMAALVPGAHRPVELVPGDGKVGLKVGENILRHRKDRMDHFERELGSVFTTKLDSLLPPSAKVKEQIRTAKVVVATATDEIDGLCERNNVAMARRLMDDVLVQLRRALRVFFDLGIQTVIVTADHGYLFGETLASGAKMDPPGGNTVDLHQRVWIGRGGAASDSYLRLTAREVGLGGDLEIAVPWSLGAFKTPKGSTYFHGGASPQELLIPVCVFRRRVRAPEPTREIEWTLRLGSKKISTTYLSVQLEGKAIGLFELAPLTIRVEVRDGKKVLSKSVAASYGFEESTGFVRIEVGEDPRTLRPDTVTLMLLGRPESKQVSVTLVDMATERVLASIDKIDVAMAAF